MPATEDDLASRFMTPSQATRATQDTLPDRPCAPGAVLLVGINPSPVSVAAGHYYRGQNGQRMWDRLRHVALLPSCPAAWEDDCFAAAGNGLTDLVKRPTSSLLDLSPAELYAGRAALADKIRAWKPGLLLFAFRAPAEQLLGRDVRPGRCADYEGVPTFLMVGPYAAAKDVAANLGELRSFVALPRGMSGSAHS